VLLCLNIIKFNDICLVENCSLNALTQVNGDGPPSPLDLCKYICIYVSHCVLCFGSLLRIQSCAILDRYTFPRYVEYTAWFHTSCLIQDSRC